MVSEEIRKKDERGTTVNEIRIKKRGKNMRSAG
jgi:hypothetical protein